MKLIKPQEIGHGTGRVVDVRERDEFARERLAANCECAPLGHITQASASWDRSEPLLLICKSGARSRQAAALLEGLGFQHVASLEGGLQACRQAGVPIVTTTAPLPITRQVFIGAGVVLLTGLALSLVHPLFIALTWFASAMLLTAGVTGFCPMARVLAHMPWNQPSSSSCATQAGTSLLKGQAS
jgi:rhodanese-related sulfurtransferase